MQPQTHLTTPPEPRYSTAMVLIHWLMLALMVAVFASINLRELYPKGTDMRNLMKTIHFMLGLLVLVMVALRVVAKLSSPQPPAASDVAWAQWAAKIGHLALYGFMVVMPLLGWATLSAAGKPVPFFGLELPALLATNKELAHNLQEVHETIGELGYWLIGLHAAAALLHHFVFKDGLMKRMSLSRA